MKKRILSLLLALTMVFALVPAVSAGSAPAVSSNINDHFYINVNRWTDPIKSTLYAENGGYVRVEYVEEDYYSGTPAAMVVEYYDGKMNFLSGMELARELPIYGGVYISTDYNFLVTGQDNEEENDAAEVFRITRYTKDWKRLDSASLYGANTIHPFDAGCVRFDRSGNMLYIRTCHEMYTSEDGLNHQANVMIALRVSDMTITDSFTDILNRNYGYISHSFNQFVRVDGDTLLAVDHGDALPRSVVLIKYPYPAGSEKFFGKVTYVNALNIPAATGHYNDTGVAVGGFECSSSHYLIAGCSTDPNGGVDQMRGQRNIFITATPKNNFTDEATQVLWLTAYSNNAGVQVSPPHLLKLDEDRFFLTWTEDDELKYCLLDGTGRLDGRITTEKGSLSDCQPILVGTRAVWYVTDDSAPVFYQIELNPHDHDYDSLITAPTCTSGGHTTHTCTICGDSYTDAVLPALGHEWKILECARCFERRDTPFADVPSDAWYKAPVLWAVTTGITQGTGGDAFSPEAPCTRAQVVTFLWRSFGQPQPGTADNPFTDIAPGDYYYNAVLWAVEQGITVGTAADAFSPEATCTRAQVAAFLWRTAGCPDHSVFDNPFTDLAETWYVDPVLWAYDRGITQGDGHAWTFNPDGECTRAQIVTFLHRFKTN